MTGNVSVKNGDALRTKAYLLSLSMIMMPKIRVCAVKRHRYVMSSWVLLMGQIIDLMREG